MQPAWCLFYEAAFGAIDVGLRKPKEAEVNSIYRLVTGGEIMQLVNTYTPTRKSQSVGGE